jgi:hypothetical protein
MAGEAAMLTAFLIFLTACAVGPHIADSWIPARRRKIDEAIERLRAAVAAGEISIDEILPEPAEMGAFDLINTALNTAIRNAVGARVMRRRDLEGPTPPG